MNAKENPQTKHLNYAKNLAQKIENSSLKYEEISIEQAYGEYMDFQDFEHKSGQEYGDIDILIEKTEGNLYIEIKTNPKPEDLKCAKQQEAKAAYLLDSIEYTCTLTDKEIDQLTAQEISNWNLEHTKFEPPLEHLQEKDKDKNKPQKHQQTQQTGSEPDFHIENDFTWESKEVQTENLPQDPSNLGTKPDADFLI